MNKIIKKAIIPAAGWGTRSLPITKVLNKALLPINNIPVAQYLVEEALNAGIEEIIFVISPREKQIANYFSKNQELEDVLLSKNKKALFAKIQKTNLINNISFVIQEEQLGLAHSILMAEEKIDGEPFVVMLADDLIQTTGLSSTQQMINQYKIKNSTIIGIQEVPLDQVDKYGVVIPVNSAAQKEQNIFAIKGAVEKPDKDEAPSNFAIIGRYLFQPTIFNFIKNTIPLKATDQEINVVDAFDEILITEKIYGLKISGKRYDTGTNEGYLKAILGYSKNN